MENYLATKHSEKMTFQSPVDPINYRVITYISSQNPPNILLLLYQEMVSWRNTCSKTLREEK
jgi:hypothetical protein